MPGLILLATSITACPSCGTQSNNGEALLSHVPLVDGAVETERTAVGSKVNVTYETKATLEQTTQHYRTVMSEPPWRVSTFDVDYRLGSAFIVFRSDEEGLLGFARVRRQADDSTLIDVEIAPIPTTTPAATETPA